MHLRNGTAQIGMTVHKFDADKKYVLNNKASSTLESSMESQISHGMQV